MKFLHLLLFLSATTASAQFFGGSSANSTPQARRLNITADVSFLPRAAERPTPRDVSAKPRLVNGVANAVNVCVANLEAEPIVVEFIGASLVDVARNVVVKNFTSVKVGRAVGHDLQLDQLYSFTADLAEQELNLVIAVIITTPANEVVSVQAYNGPVIIAEPDASMSDPQMLFLYLLLAAGCAGTLYAVYNAWIASVRPKPRRKFDTPKPAAAAVLASTTGAQYDEDWIPPHHLGRLQTRARSRPSGPGGGKKGKKTTE